MFPTVAICMSRSTPLVPLDSCLIAASRLSAHVSACSFTVSQASDLALLVGMQPKRSLTLLLAEENYDHF